MNQIENRTPLNALTEINRMPPKTILGTAGSVFLNAFYNLALITQEDEDTVNTVKVEIEAKLASIDEKPGDVNSSGEAEAMLPEDMFAFSREVVKASGKLIVSNIPQTGGTVIAKRKNIRKRVKLLEVISSGGEGTVYRTNISNLVAKIYKKENISEIKHEKIKLMLTKKFSCRGVSFPFASVYTEKNEFIGYLMPQARGKELQKCVFIPQLLVKHFPDWNKRDTVQLCITILKKLKYLHSKNIILGDINPNNILVASPKEVYFVDTDSFQIEGFPCPVGTTNFTAPEIQGKKYESFLRTMGNEHFAVATLLFMIMLPGKPPYSVQGGENQSRNICNMNFAYPMEEQNSERAPVGPWRFCWSHLPYTIKEAFYQTFKDDQAHSTEKTRHSSGDWLQMFEDYLTLLESEEFAAKDEMSIELFPQHFKKITNPTNVHCRLCGTVVDKDTTKQGYCKECLKKGETYHCSRCGGDILYSNYQKLVRHSKKHEICRDCYERKNTIYKHIECLICGTSFSITYGELDFYEEKDLLHPKKCLSCRKKRKKQQTI